MNDWFYCNKCSIKYSQQQQFYLTQCRHIFCSKCYEKLKHANACLECLRPTVSVLIDRNLEAAVLEYFTPIDTLVKKVLEVYKFQTSHRRIIFRNLLTKYNETRKEAMRVSSVNKRLMKENQALRSMHRNTGNNSSQFQTSTPKSQLFANFKLHYPTPNSSMGSTIPPQMCINTPRRTPTYDHMNVTSRYSRRANNTASGSSGFSSGLRMPAVMKTSQHPLSSNSSKGNMRSIGDFGRRGK